MLVTLFVTVTFLVTVTSQIDDLVLDNVPITPEVTGTTPVTVTSQTDDLVLDNVPVTPEMTGTIPVVTGTESSSISAQLTRTLRNHVFTG